ncbi:MAG: MFS transporter [Alphaproteobacteria bacterium]
MSHNKPARLSRRIVLAYIAPACVIALPTIPVYIFLPSMYGDDLGLGLAVTGGVLLVARLFDTVSDPLVGMLTDRFSFRGAKRKPFIALGAVIAGPALWMLLMPSPGADAAYLLLWSVVLYVGWTLIYVPYTTWGAELSEDYNERTRLTTWREGASLLGILGAGAVVAIAAPLTGETEPGSLTDPAGLVALTTVLLGAVVFPVILSMTPDSTLPRGRRQTGRFAFHDVLDVFRNALFRRLLVAWFINGIANGVPAVLFFLYLEFGLGVTDDQRPVFVFIYFMSAVAAMPLWFMISQRLGKHRTWCWAMVMTCLAFVFVPVLPQGALILFGIVCVISGLGLGADLALPPAIQADVADYDRWKVKRRRTGLQFSLWSMSTKLALALAAGLALPGVEVLGFNPEQPDEQGRMVLAVIYALVPVVIKIAAVAVMWRFPLTQSRQAAIRRRLDRCES